jgi:protease-4
LKDQPSLEHPLSGPGRTVLQALIMDMYDQFVEKVALGRKLDQQKVRELADGRVYTGRQAFKLGLIDAIGGEAEARRWLQSDRGVAPSLPVRDVLKRDRLEALFGASADEFFGDLLKALFSQHTKLDGAMALWQPFETN